MAKFKVGNVLIDPQDSQQITILFVGEKSYFYKMEYSEASLSCEFIDSRYVLKPKEITITKEDLARAWDVALPFSNDSKNSASFDAICKELGLE